MAVPVNALGDSVLVADADSVKMTVQSPRATDPLPCNSILLNRAGVGAVIGVAEGPALLAAAGFLLGLW